MTSYSESSSVSAAMLPTALKELARRHPDNPLLWAQAYRRFGGRPMEIPPALHAVYQDDHPLVVVQKPAQVGVTESNLTVGLWAAATRQGGRGNVLYLMHTQEAADRLSQGRLAKAITESPALRELMAERSDTYRGPQRMQMRTVGEGMLYLVGSDQVGQYQGIDADLVILDEFDLMKGEVLPNAVARLRSSSFARMRVTSTPTIPEFGVNGLIQRSDERHYEVRCASCERWLEPQFPANADFEQDLVVCDCGASLPHDLPGRWVPLRPDATDVRGYVLNRLTLPNPPLREMRLAASGTIGMRQEEFWRQDLGVPFVSEDARLSAANLDACRDERLPPQLQYGKPEAVVMGVDVSGDAFWVVVRAFFAKRSYPLLIERVPGDWEQLDAICERFNVGWCVVDALPDQRGAARFLQRVMRGPTRTRAFICFYNRRTAHDSSWGRTPTINAARTLALDETFDSFRRGLSRLPMRAREAAGGAYYEHLQALVRTTEADEFGQPVPAYRHTRPDDFAHAETYITLAATLWGRWNRWWD